jgi:protein required for attachment to host cells
MEKTMKKLQSLYLLASDDGYRLVHTHDLDLAEIGLNAAGQVSEDATGHGVTVPHSHGSDNRVEQDHIRLAKAAVEALQTAWTKGTYDRIVIAAGPKTLGHLRSDMPKALHAHVAAELHKDLMKIPVHELASHFKEVTEASEGA